ncbi:MAG TPA: dihydrolipoamide acetyltransferase family protein [Candidatus Limnocylindrales bacterium]|nr:dihydrolipoamide acetyltransferase family protein [Candidatus Limnocylindrales bacterium]
MAFEFALPDLGEGITEGEIRGWLVKEGDFVKEHQPVLEIETDKAVVEVPSPKAGKVLKLSRKEGEVVRVGEVLMILGREDEVIEAVEESVSVVGVLPEGEKEVLAVPAVRALAKELGVNLETLQGSGPGGSITREDVIQASEKAKKMVTDLYGPVEVRPIKGIRKTLIKNLLKSKGTTAYVTSMDEADVTDLWNLREKEKEVLLKKGIHLTFLPFFIKAVQHALIEHPLFNASIDEEEGKIILKKYYHIGIAVDTPDGLMVPVIKEVDKKTILMLAEEIHNLGEKARQRKIRLEEMRGSTFTITNYGNLGGTFATPIINYPDVAILGTGKISEKPWVKGGEIVIRKILPLSLTFDHRITDGAEAARFLTKIIRYLEDPTLLFIASA